MSRSVNLDIMIASLGRDIELLALFRESVVLLFRLQHWELS